MVCAKRVGDRFSTRYQFEEDRPMPRFLIEVPHEAERIACARVVEVFLKTGSHFLTHADWGCLDGEHKAWMIGEFNSKEEARSVLPPTLRSQGTIVQLNYFTLDEIDEILRGHPASRGEGVARLNACENTKPRDVSRVTDCNAPVL